MIVLATLLLGCAKGPTPDALAPFHMNDVTDSANAARLAIVAGYPADARRHLGWLAEHGFDRRRVDRTLIGHAERFAEQARRGAAVDRLEALAEAVAGVGEACGACHVAAGLGPRFAEAPVASGSDVTAHMLRHQWGVDSLWEGLVGPHDALWKAGATTFFEVPVDPERDPVIPAAFVGLADRVHELGSESLALFDPGSRARNYAGIIAACGECHQALGGPPGSDYPVPDE